MITFRLLALPALLGMMSVASFAQEASKEVQVDIKKVEAGAQNTPQFSAPNVKDKRWTPKTWLEVDVPFSLKKAKSEQSPGPMVDSLDFKIYVVLNKRDATSGKYIMLTASITYLNANSDDRESHAMAFASPSALANILGNPRFTAADVTPTALGVEVFKGGALAGGYSTNGGKFWEKADNFLIQDGALLPKAKTPFAPLWGDYDLETKQ